MKEAKEMKTEQQKEILLEVNNLKTWFPVKKGVFRSTVGHVKALDGVSFTVYKGETLGLVGESGCGKSTLGKTLLRLVKSQQGSVLYHDEAESVDLLKLDEKSMGAYRKKMQIVFQDPYSSLNPAFTIFTSLKDPLNRFGIHGKAAQRKLIGDLLEAVNMRPEYMDRYPHEFSGGQRQRIGIARALSVDPQLVICDEAVSALDVSIRAQVLNLLLELKEKRNLTYIFITHDLSVVEYISDRIAVMYLGKIVELAPTQGLYDHTMHPYTQALFSAIPLADLDAKKQRIVLEGDVPSPVNPPSGCSFHPRCRYCMDRCRTEEPLLQPYEIEGNLHYVACHLMDTKSYQKVKRGE
jgi:oligopeptide/dipeptide ABC transporter ATP-binding protein